jgi:hypothetical protein
LGRALSHTAAIIAGDQLGAVGGLNQDGEVNELFPPILPGESRRPPEYRGFRTYMAMFATPQSRDGSIQFGTGLTNRLTATREPVLFGVRLWASICLALFVAFWLELDNPFWAGVSAAVVCQPQLGASLRKGWYRMIGTVVGAMAIVVLTAWFPQDRIGFLGLLALWVGVCAFAATVLRNLASYSAKRPSSLFP